MGTAFPAWCWEQQQFRFFALQLQQPLSCPASKPTSSPQDPMMPSPGCSDWPEFPDEEQHPPWPPPRRPGWVPVQSVVGAAGLCSCGVVGRDGGSRLWSGAWPRGDAGLKLVLLSVGGSHWRALPA